MRLGHDAELELLASLIHQEFKVGQNIITQGDRGDFFYLLVRGRCTVAIKAEGEPEKVVRHFEVRVIATRSTSPALCVLGCPPLAGSFVLTSVGTD